MYINNSIESEQEIKEKEKARKRDIIQTYCAAVSLPITILAFVISIWAFCIANNTYKYSTASYKPILTIDKKDNDITINNKDTKVFDVYEVVVDGAKKYECSFDGVKNDIELESFHYSYKKGDNTKLNLNNLSIDTDLCYQVKGYKPTVEESQQLNDNITDWINIFSENNDAKFEYQYDVYYMQISYLNKYYYEPKTIYIECVDDGSGSFKYKIPWTDYSSLQEYKNKQKYFEFAPSQRGFGWMWKRVTDWIESEDFKQVQEDY